MKNRIQLWHNTAVVTVLIMASSTFAQRPKPDTTTIKGHTMYTLMKPGGIPAIFEPEFIPVNQADSFYYPDEPLIVVTDGKQPRVTAPGIWMPTRWSTIISAARPSP